MHEEWRDIKCASRYEVSSLGRVRNKKTGKLIATFKRRGYSRLDLRTSPNEKVRASVGRLVAEAFLPDFDPNLEVDHINRIRDDDRAENLRMVNGSQNGYNRNASLDRVRQIIELHKQGFDPEQIFEQLGYYRRRALDV